MSILRVAFTREMEFGDSSITHVGDLIEPDRPRRRIDRERADVGQAVPRLGLAPHVHVVGLAVREDVADLLARHPGGRGAAYVSWLHAELLGLGEIHLHVDLRDEYVELLLRVERAVDALHHLEHLVRFLLERVQIVAVDAHDDGIARSRQHFLDALSQIGLHVALDSGIPETTSLTRRRVLS